MTHHEHGPNCNHDHGDEGTSMAQEVRNIVGRCLYTDAEMKTAEKDEEGVPKGAVIVRGIVQDFGFHPERLMAEAENVRAILRKVVRDEFTDPTKGGWSFLMLAEDREGNLWAEHPTMEAMTCLAMGLRWAKCLLPRSFWGSMPGGVPYYTFDFEKPPQPYYLIKRRKEPEPLDAAGEARLAIWKRIAELPAKANALLGQVLWEELDVDIVETKQMTQVERVWVLTNAGVEPDKERLSVSLKDAGIDPATVFG